MKKKIFVSPCLCARHGFKWFCTAVSRMSRMITKLKTAVLDSTLNPRSGVQKGNMIEKRFPSCLCASVRENWFCTRVSRMSRMIAKLKTAVLNDSLNARSGCPKYAWRLSISKLCRKIIIRPGMLPVKREYSGCRDCYFIYLS